MVSPDFNVVWLLFPGRARGAVLLRAAGALCRRAGSTLGPRLCRQLLASLLQHGPVRLSGRHRQLHHLVELVLGPIIAEDPHHADRNGLVQTAPQRFAVEGEHEGDVLLTGVVNDGVQGVVQPTWSKDDENDKKLHHVHMLATLAAKGF